MAADPKKPTGEGPKNLMPVLVPVAGVAFIIVLVIVIASTSESPKSTAKDGKTKTGIETNSLVSGPGRPMSDGSNGGTDDPDLKPIGTEGLKYRDIKEGEGPEAPPNSMVEVHYTGWKTNGDIFDSSKKRNETFVASLQPGHPTKNVIPGWQQGMVGMKVGGIRKLVIPASLAYGARGAGKDIPGGATLIFEVELVGIK